VLAYFVIELHKRDIYVLNKVQSFFGGIGKINVSKTRDSVTYSVTSVKDLKNVKTTQNFDNYPLITQKRADFELLKMAVDLISRKEHLTPEGFHKILAIKRSRFNKQWLIIFIKRSLSRYYPCTKTDCKITRKY